VLDRARLLRGNVIDEPAIGEEHDASTLVHPDWSDYGRRAREPRVAALTIEQSAVSRAIQPRSACSITYLAL